MLPLFNISPLKKEKIEVISKELQNPKLSYENLQPFSETYDFIQAITELKNMVEEKNIDWNMQVGIINYLRRLLRYNNDIFNNIFYSLKFHQKTIEYLDSFRSVLSRCSLTLMTEIFNIPRKEINEETKKVDPLCGYISMAVPKLIVKAFCNQSFIQKEAQECLNVIKDKMLYYSTFLAYLKAMESKKKEEVNLAFESAKSVLSQLSPDSLKKPEHIQETVKVLHKIFDLKKDPYPSVSSEIGKKIKEILGEELNGLLANSKPLREQFDTILKYEKKPPKKETDKEGFRKFVRQSKEKSGLRSSTRSSSGGKNNLVANLVNKTKKNASNVENIKKGATNNLKTVKVDKAKENENNENIQKN